MAGPIRIAILADARPAVQGMHQVQESATGMGSKISKVGSGIKTAFVGMGAAFAAAGAVEGIKTVIDQAASLSAAIGTTKTIFKDSAGDMLKWGKTAATSLGLSQAEALNAGKTFGGFFTGVGMGSQKAAEMSKSWTTMAANMAAFGDIPVADSLEAVKSAMIGEYDPIQKLIPTLSAASLQQKAMELSGKKNAKALTDQDKAAALNAIMMDSVANKAGEAERKQGGYAVQMDKLKAQLKDAAGAIGSTFLPALTKGMGFINDTALPAVKKLGDFLGPKIKAGFDVLSSFKPPKALVDVAQSSQVQSILDKAKTGFMSLGPTVSGAISAVTPIIGSIADTASAAFGKAVPQIKAIFGTIGDIVGQIFEVIKTQINNAVTIIQFIWQNFGASILQYLSSALAGVVTVIQGAFNIIKGVFDVIIGVLTGDWGRAWDGVKGIVSGAWTAIQGIWGLIKAGATLLGQVVGKILSLAWNAIKSAASAAWNGILSLISGVWNGIKAGAAAAWNGIKSLITSAWAGIKSAISSAVSGLGSLIAAGWNAIKSATSAAWNAIKSFIANFWTGLKIVVSTAISTVKTVITSGWTAVKTATATAWNAIKSAVTTGIGNVLTAVRALPGKVKSAVSGAATWLVNVGMDMIRGVISGVGKMVGALRDKVKSVIGGIVPFSKGLLKENSPSKVFMEIGKGIVDGTVVGIETGREDLKRATAGLVDAVVKAFPASVKKTFAKGTKLSVIEAWKKKEIAAGKVRGARKNALLDLIAKDNAKLQDLAGRRDTIAESLKAKNDEIAAMQDARAGVVTSVAQAITSSFKLVNEAGDQGISTIDSMLERSRAALENAPEFGQLMEKLAGMSISPQILKQLAEAGPAAGLATARALAEASSAELNNLNINYQKSATSIDGILQRSRDALTQAQEFSAGLQALAARGISPQVLNELATAGPAAGMETMKALTAASADQLAELSKNYADIAKTGQAAGEVVAGHMYDTGILAAQKLAEGFASQQASLEAQILQQLDSLTKKINLAVGNVAPKISPVEVKGSLKPGTKKVKVGKAYKEVPTGATGGAVTVTINTGVVVDKRAMVDTISTAFNEVSTQLGRPISMSVAS